MDAIITPGASLHGAIALPADKAIAHRAVLFGALAGDRTVLTPWAEADDCQFTLEAVRQLGVSAGLDGQRLTIEGVGLNGLRQPSAPIFCGESGTTIRLLCGLLAGQSFPTQLTAAPGLSRRPMRRVIEPLSQMGAQLSGAAGQGGEHTPPIAIRGRRPLRGIEYAMPVASAQVKSAILIAGLCAEGRTTVIEPAGTRDHTERLLERLGVRIQRDGGRISVEPPTKPLQALGELQIPGDPSSAAFFLVAAAITTGSSLRIEQVSLNPSRIRLLDVLRRMGARMTWTATDDAWEPRGRIDMQSSPLRGLSLGPEDISELIDELPILMVAACAAAEPTELRGIQELRVKETDRVQSMVTGLGAMGGRLEVQGDRMVIHPAKLRGAAVEGFGDHRTVMSLAVAALRADGPTTIHGAEAIRKSFPSFFSLLSQAAGPDVVRLG